MDKDKKGFITLDRSIFEHWIFKDAEKFRAFVDLIQLARFKEEKLLIGNKITSVPRGSYYTSELKLAEKWGWSRNKTRDFLRLLEDEEMITKKGTSKGTMLTIVNYSFYQGEGTTKKHQKNNEKTSEGTSKKHQKVHQKNIKRYTKEQREQLKPCKQGKQGEEVPTPLSLSFPSNIHKDIFNYLGELSYKMWFMDAGIEERDEVIEIYIEDEMKQKAITGGYESKLSMLFNKTVKAVKI